MLSFDHIYNEKSEKAVPYIYYLEHKETKQFYIGVRFGKLLKRPSHLDLPKYRTSSKLVKEIGFENFNWWILVEFLDNSEESKQAAFEYEQQLIKEHIKNPLNINMAVRDKNFHAFYTSGMTTALDTRDNTTKMISVDEYRNHSYYVHPATGKVCVIDKDGNTKHITSEEYHNNKDQYKTPASDNVVMFDTELNVWVTVPIDEYRSAKRGKYINNFYNSVIVRDKNGNVSMVSTDDPRFLSGELIALSKGRVTVKDKNGNVSVVSTDDPRYVSGELVHISTGMVAVKDKNGNSFTVSVDDPRFLSGELIALSKGRVTVKDKNGNTCSVSVDDPRYMSGELVHFIKNKVLAKDVTGKKFHVDMDDPRLLSGELVGHTKGKTLAIDEFGNKIYVDKGDPRFKSGIIVGNKKKKVPLIVNGIEEMVYPNDYRLKDAKNNV